MTIHARWLGVYSKQLGFRVSAVTKAADVLTIFKEETFDILLLDNWMPEITGIELGAERTFEQDPKYALRLLVDIAIRALSPAVNDPITAVQALDQN